MTTRKALSLLVLVVGVVAAGAFAYYRYSQAGPEESGTGEQMEELFARPRPVQLQEVQVEAGDGARTYPGTVRASRETFLSFRVSGPLHRVEVEPGDIVEEGELLMAIDNRDYRDRIGVLRAELGGAEAQLENAKQEYQRAEALLADQIIPQSRFDSAKSAYQSAQAAVGNIRAQLRIARHKLADTRLEAPFDGVISVKRVENHEMVRAGQIVLGLQDLASLRFAAGIPETEIAHSRLEEGLKASVTLSTLGEQRFPARLEKWNADPDPATRTYRVTFSIPAPGQVKILPGMTGELHWPRHAATGAAFSVPASAVVSDGKGGSAVWVYDAEGKTARLRPVSLGEPAGHGRVGITGGLAPGDRVVTAGASFITEGMALKPMQKQ